MLDQRFAAAAGIAFLVLAAGCVTSSGNAAPTTSAPMSAAPKVIVTKEVDACPQSAPSGGATPVQTATIAQPVTVDDAYDQIIVNYHATGVGNVTVGLRSQESGKDVWFKSETINSVAEGTNCGDHAHKGGGDNRNVESGSYTLHISYEGAVAIHVDMLEIQSGTPMPSMTMDMGR